MCQADARKAGVRLVAPPGIRDKVHDGPDWKERSAAIEEALFLGLPDWKKSHDYHRRSLAESAMWRLKSAFGDSLRSRNTSNQNHEALWRAHRLNRWSTPKAFPSTANAA
jgi:hypothetical protein